MPGDRAQLAVHADHRRAAGGEVEVRALLLEQHHEQLVDVEALGLSSADADVAARRGSARGAAGPNTESIACWIS